MKHDNSISVIRVTAMTMIVLFHCLGYNTGIWHDTPVYDPITCFSFRCISNVGLDAFVFISGLLYYRIFVTGKYDKTGQFLVNKVKRLLVPYLVWGVFLCLFFSDIIEWKSMLYGVGHLWFLMMLFEVFVIVELTKNIWKGLKLRGSIVVLLVLCALYGIVTATGLLPADSLAFLRPQLALNNLPIFYVGMMTEKFKVYDKIPVPSRLIAVLLMVVLFAIGVVPYVLHLPLKHMIEFAATYAMLLLAYNALRQSNAFWSGKANKTLLLLDKYSLAVYIIHHIYIYVYLYRIPGSTVVMHECPMAAPLIMFAIIAPLSLLTAYVLGFLPGAKYIVGADNKKKK